MLASGAPGILITTLNNHFASKVCGGFVPSTLTGNGLLGTITSPACGASSNKVTLSFHSAMPGHQKHMIYTGVKYDLAKSIAGSVSTAAVDAHMTMTFPSTRTLTCT